VDSQDTDAKRLRDDAAFIAAQIDRSVRREALFEAVTARKFLKSVHRDADLPPYSDAGSATRVLNFTWLMTTAV